MYIWILLPRYLVHEVGKPVAYTATSFGLFLLFNVLAMWAILKAD